MEGENHGTDSVANATQLVHYDDDEDNEDKLESSHSGQVVSGRGATLLAHGQAERASAEMVGDTQIVDDGIEYEDDGVSNAIYAETTFRQEIVVEETQIMEAEGSDLAADAMEAFRGYAAGTQVGSTPDANTLSPHGAGGSGTEYSREDLQERGVEETALEEAILEDAVHDHQSNLYLPDEGERIEEHSSFTSMQQLQLRAQILVYGDLIKGILPEESLMSSAFSNVDEDAGQESDKGVEGLNWERAWQIAAEKDAEKKEAETLPNERNNEKIDVMTGGDAVNAGGDNLEPDLELPPTDMNGISSSLTVNLDAVVENIVASSVNSIDISTVKELSLELQTRSPSLDPWLKPASQVTPTTGSTPQVDSSHLTPSWPHSSTWVTDVANPVSGSQGGILNTAPTNAQHAEDGGIVNKSPAVAADGSDQGSRKRKSRARERKTPAKTPVSKTPAAKSAGATPRRSRAKKTPPVPAASPGSIEDPKLLLTANVPSRLIYESSAAVVAATSGSPASPNAGKRRAPQSLNLHAVAQSWVEQAKVSFEEAISAASLTAEEAEFAKSRSTPTQPGFGEGSQFDSAVAAVSAAAAVARAAAEAARVAYEAALQATLLLSEGIDKSNGKNGAGGGQSDKDGGGRRSAIAAAKEEARKRATATTSTKLHPQSTVFVLKAAKLMAEAASQAGAVLAIGNSSVTGTPVPTTRGRSGKEEVGMTSPEVVNVAEPPPLIVKETRGSMKKGARKRGKDTLALEARKTPVKEGPFSPDKGSRRLPDQLASPSNATYTPEILHQNQIALGSLIEVMNEEEGLRGGWFSARVLEMRVGEAYVKYDEILTDDGTTQLKEWFPIEGKPEGSVPGRPRIRVISPNNIAREEGRRKRRRTTFGPKSWSVGDLVDAFVQDGWWEGIVKAIDDDDENKVTVHFPGEGDTSMVKAWNLRPSFLWKDGRWEQWTRNSTQQQLESPATKKLKMGVSPKVQARKTGHKSNPDVMKISDEATETPRPSRSRKPIETDGTGPLSPTINTRSSPRQKIPAKRKDVKLASPRTEESAPNQESTPVSTRTRSIAEDTISPVKQLRKRSAAAAGLQKPPLSPVVPQIENQSKKVASPSKVNKSSKKDVTIASPSDPVRVTRQKSKL